MKKNEKKKPSKGATSSPRRIVDQTGSIDWGPLADLAKAAMGWTHALAMELCRPEERARIDRVFRRVPALFDGAHVDIAIEDALLALRVVGRGVERDQRMTPGTFDMLATVLDFAFGPIAEAHARRPAMPPPIVHAAPRIVTAPSIADVFALVGALGFPSGHGAAPFHAHH